MKLLKLFLFSSYVCLSAHASAQETVTSPGVIVIGDNPWIVESAANNTDDFALVPHAGDLRNTIGDLTEANGFVVMHSDQAPNLIDLGEVLSALEYSARPATYMVFLEESQDVSWLNNLYIPKNVKLGLAIRNLDTAEVRNVYEELGVPYDGNGVVYRPEVALARALDEMSASGMEFVEHAGKVTTLGLFDTGFVDSGASSNQSESLKASYSPQSFEMPEDWMSTRGLQYLPTSDGTITTDMDVIVNFLIANDCDSSEWYDRIQEEIAFQSFPNPKFDE